MCDRRNYLDPAVTDRRYRSAVWHRDCSEFCVLPLVFLGLGAVCALISRILLVIAAARISGWWVLGVWLPFGPLCFRLNYPEESRRSMMFRWATLPCLLLYLVISSGPTLSYYKRKTPKASPPRSSEMAFYGLEKLSPKSIFSHKPDLSLEERRLVNAKELERLQALSEELRLRKRDLLHSDTEANRIYVVDLALYNQALAKAMAEKNALAGSKK